MHLNFFCIVLYGQNFFEECSFIKKKKKKGRSEYNCFFFQNLDQLTFNMFCKTGFNILDFIQKSRNM